MHFDLHEIFLEREVGIKSIGDFRFSHCRFVFGEVSCAGFLSSSVLVSSVQLPTSMSNTGGTWDNAKKDFSRSEHVPMVLTLRVNMLMTLFLPHAHFFTMHAVRTRCMSTDRSNGNLHKSSFFSNGRDCHPARIVHKKRPIFDHRLCFSVWPRLKNYDPTSRKPHARSSHHSEGCSVAVRAPFHGDHQSARWTF